MSMQSHMDMGNMDVLDEVREMLGGIDVLFLMLVVILCGRTRFRGLGGCADSLA